MNDKTFAIGYEEAHTEVKSIIKRFYLESRGIKVLDAAAGNGHLTKWLLQEGFSVIPVDIKSSQWMLNNCPIEIVDLNKVMPYEDQEFDIIISIETIEHVENPYFLIREFSRILKSKGLLIITTPNVHGIKSRLKYLILGYPVLFEYCLRDSLEHLYPINIGQLLTSFDKNDLDLSELYSFGKKVYLLQKLLYNIANKITEIPLYIMKAKRKHLRDHYLFRFSKQMLNELRNDVGLIVVAKKK